MLRTKKFSAFGLILSDILANGVIVILILMMVTIMIENEAEKQKIEQAKDVTVILGREIMTSLVMNSLKSGPPSVLHDYEHSFIDKRIIKEKIPVFQLINDGLYELHSKTFWDKETLLTNDSSLDNYLSNLSERHKKLFRIDIFSVNHFYVFMSVLRSHAMTPRHWHFMGESLPGNFTNLALSNQGHDFKENNGIDGTEHDQSSKSNKESGIDSELDTNQSLGRSNGYLDNLETLQEAQRVSEVMDWLDGDTQIGKKENFDESYQGIEPSKANQISVSIAGISLPGMDSKSDINQILATVYSIMLISNKMIDNDTFTSLEHIDPLQINGVTQSISSSESFKLWMGEVFFLSELPRKDKFLINHNYNDEYYSSVGFKANNLQDSLKLYNHSLTKELVDKEHRLSFNLNTYPLIHKGNRVFVTPNTIISYIDDKPTSNYRWRTISLIDLVKGQIIIGLVYAAYDTVSGEMIIKAEENKPNLLGQDIITKHKSIVNKIEKLSSLFMVIILSIVMMYFYKIRRGDEK